MQKLQLYIAGTRVDLFKDETVSLTQTIQNVKDINKIFTEFSKTFSLPASPTNNKIFKHYYNFDIQGGFDARNKVSASLELNTIPFKDGFIRLEGVNLKRNLAHTYRVTFFGNTINLNDILGATQLSGLSGLSSDNLTYTNSSVLSKLRNPPTGNICCPLITHTQRLIFDPANNKQAVGNLAWQGSTSDNGVLFSDLKYAIRLQAIIAAIQSQVYENEQSITFSSDFFNNTSNTAFYNLWMWLHRKKGGVESTVQLQLNFTQLNDLVTTFGNLPSVSTAANGTLTLGVLSGSDVYVSTSLELTPTNNTVEYSVRVSRNGADVAQLNNVTGPQTLFNSPQTALGAGTYAVLIASTTGITFAATNIEWEITVVNTQPGQGSGGGTQTLSNSSTFQNQSDVQFVISEQIPEMTIIDFLTSIFRMFNLTAFVDNAGVIVVKTLDSYYAAGASDPIIIDQYLDVTKSTVDIALPFREVVYRFKGINTFLAKQYNQVNNLEWGSLKYTLDEDIYDAPTNTYSVEIPFEHVLYERIFPTASTTPTSVQYGYFVDDNQEAYFGLPLIFYAIRIPSGTAISFKNSAEPNANVQITQYIIPSNSKELLASSSTTNINFGQMINEYTPNDVFSGTLFANYYNTYISEVFNRNKRLTKVTAYLPLKIYHNLELNSKMQINLQNYKINSITTNLTNGKSEIELLNITQ